MILHAVLILSLILMLAVLVLEEKNLRGQTRFCGMELQGGHAGDPAEQCSALR